MQHWTKYRLNELTMDSYVRQKYKKKIILKTYCEKKVRIGELVPLQSILEHNIATANIVQHQINSWLSWTIIIMIKQNNYLVAHFRFGGS